MGVTVGLKLVLFLGLAVGVQYFVLNVVALVSPVFLR